MGRRFILTDYVVSTMVHAIYNKMEEGTFVGRIPLCKGVIAFGATLRDCEDKLRTTYTRRLDFRWS